MANPKYADLPGIAHDQPDVYETNDLPESDQGKLSISDVVVDQSDSVEQLKISTDEAYNKFKGSSLISENVDFTDSIRPHRKTGYYDVRSGEWAMLGDKHHEQETPIQTYKRLQIEIEQLYENVKLMQQSLKTTEESSQIPPIALAQQIEELQKELENLHMEKILGSEAIEDMTDPLGSSYKKLVSHLENFKKSPLSVTEKEPKGTIKSSSEGSLKYELFLKPSEIKSEELSRLTCLEQRLKNLENIIGQDKKKLSFLTSNTDGKSITSAINVLSSKLNLLDPSYLDQIENRLVLLHQCMQQISEKKQQIEDADRQNKVHELYELGKRVEELSTSLPQVVERLIALKDLHEQALSFSKALTHLDTTQQQIVHTLQNNEKLLKEVQSTFMKNTEMIESNITNLNTRIEHLKK